MHFVARLHEAVEGVKDVTHVLWMANIVDSPLVACSFSQGLARIERSEEQVIGYERVRSWAGRDQLATNACRAVV